MGSYESSATVLLTLAVLSARIGTALAMFPMFSAGGMPVTVRATFTVGVSLCLLPVVGMGQMLALGSMDAMTLALLLIKEVALGFGLGLVGSMGFWAIHSAGVIIENQAGLSMATTLDPLQGQEDSLIGGFLVQVMSVLFLVSGGFLAMLGAMFESFRVWPIAQLAPQMEPAIWLEATVQSVRWMFELALRAAAPFVLLMLMVEVGLGLLGRYAPQFSVFFLALPIKAAVLLILLLVYVMVLSDGSALPDVAGAMRHLFQER